MESCDDEPTMLSARSSGHDGRLSFNVAGGEDIFAEMRRNLGLAVDADADTPSGPSEAESGGRDEEEGSSAAALAERAGVHRAPSLGSYAHGTGECRPCAFFWKQRGCKDGLSCTHCHLCPPGEIKARRAARSQEQRLQRHDSLRQEQARQEEDAQLKTTKLSLEPRKVLVSSLLAPPGPTRGLPPHLTAEGALLPRAAGQQQAARQGLFDGALDDLLSESSSSGEEQLQEDDVDLSGLDFHALPPRWSVSLGSVMHGTGECKPCAWFWKPQGCQNGKDCRHCHLCPLGEIRERKRKSRARRSSGTPLGAALDGPAQGHAPRGAPPLSLSAQLLPLEPAQQALGWAEIAGLVAGTTPVVSPTASPIAGDPAQSLADAPAAPEASGLPSIGSAWHSSGLCKPCAWFWKPQGCGNGASCQHCHICPDGEIKVRKKVKMACIRLEDNRLGNCDASAWTALAGTEPDDFPATAPAVPPPPLSMPALPSLGSALHFSGKCKPCAWFYKSQGCHNGQACAHCHLCPQGELQARMKTKRTAMRMGALVPVTPPANSQRPRLVVKIAPVLSA